MFGNILIATALSFAVGVGAVNTPESNYNNDNINNVVYDDEEYQITLTADELNNYTWENLYNYLENTGSSSNITSITYDEYTFVEDSENNTNNYYSWIYDNGSEQLVFTTSTYVEYELYHFYLDSLGEDFNTSAILNIDSDAYADIKQAIELDIQANAPQASMGSTIIDAIKSGLGLIGDLASQFLLGFSTLFWANNALTPFGTFALVMLGVAITMAVVSLVLRIIRGNTGA